MILNYGNPWDPNGPDQQTSKEGTRGETERSGGEACSGRRTLQHGKHHESITKPPAFTRTHGYEILIVVTWSAAHGRVHENFTVDRLPVENLVPEQQEQVREAFAAGLMGIPRFDEEIGWTFSPPMWVPLGVGEERLPVGDGE